MFFLLPIEAAGESTLDKIEDWVLDQGLTIIGIVIFVTIAIIVLNAIVPRIVSVSARTVLAGK